MASKRLSDKDLDSFKSLLLQVRRVLTGDISSLEADAFSTNSIKAPSDNPADAGSDSFSQEFTLELLQREEAALGEIDEALDRIDAKSFGICEECEKLIAKARLKALPFARLCIECKRAAENM